MKIETKIKVLKIIDQAFLQLLGII
jgi:hypothetical protein